MPDWIVEFLAAGHDRSAFCCGKPPLDDFLKKYAAQNQKLGYSRTYVAVPADSRDRVHGYYSLSMGSVAFANLPAQIAKRCPKYPMPVAHLGRLAVDQPYQNQRLGRLLLFDAIEKIVAAADLVAARAIEVVAIDEDARNWYLKFGFTPFVDSPLHLFLSMDTARRAVGR